MGCVVLKLKSLKHNTKGESLDSLFTLSGKNETGKRRSERAIAISQQLTRVTTKKRFKINGAIFILKTKGGAGSSETSIMKLAQLGSLSKISSQLNWGRTKS